MIEKIVHQMKKNMKHLIQKIVIKLFTLYKKIEKYFWRTLCPIKLFDEAYSLEDNVIVTVFSDKEGLFPDYPFRINPSLAKKKKSIKVSLIATAKNEINSIDEWFESIFQQTRLPDEIVVTDTGSTDGTPDRLKQLIQTSPVPVHLVYCPGGNISQGRNAAIRTALYEVIAVTDFGVRADPGWLERLLAPFEIMPETQVSGGWYRAIGKNGQPINKRFWLNLMGTDPQIINSPGASIAFRRSSWEKVGGFPEWLSMTGEDTYFDLELRRCCSYWAFVPQALVDWRAPEGFLFHLRKIAHWTSGDGESGMHAPYYWYAFQEFIGTTLIGILILFLFLAGLFFQSGMIALAGLVVLCCWLSAVLYEGHKRQYSIYESFWQVGNAIAQAIGYVSGAKRRKRVTIQRVNQAKRYYFILAGVPIDDTGGGSRFSQFAQEMIRQQYVVIYLHKFEKGETTELDIKINHPNLFHFRADQFNLQKFLREYSIDLQNHEVSVLVEVPLNDWLPLIRELKGSGADIIYDLLDDWDSSLGARWYSKATELEIIGMADQMVATTPVLGKRLESLSGRQVTLFPNAVNIRLFNPNRLYPKPADWPASDQALIYTGALYGNWFDWDLLIKIAQTFPEIAVVVIGDYRGECPVSLSNLHFLGLKRQVDLPAYLAHASAAIIPWKINPITQATSPLKVYEYLAMHLPVVAPDLPPLRHLPGLFLADHDNEFLQKIYQVLDTSLDFKFVDIFIKENCWEKRVRDLNQLVQSCSSNIIKEESITSCFSTSFNK